MQRRRPIIHLFVPIILFGTSRRHDDEAHQIFTFVRSIVHGVDHDLSRKIRSLNTLRAKASIETVMRPRIASISFMDTSVIIISDFVRMKASVSMATSLHERRVSKAIRLDFDSLHHLCEPNTTQLEISHRRAILSIIVRKSTS